MPGCLHCRELRARQLFGGQLLSLVREFASAEDVEDADRRKDQPNDTQRGQVRPPKIGLLELKAKKEEEEALSIHGLLNRDGDNLTLEIPFLKSKLSYRFTSN